MLEPVRSFLAVASAITLAAVLGFYGGRYSRMVTPLDSGDFTEMFPTKAGADSGPARELKPEPSKSSPLNLESDLDVCRRLLAQPATPARNNELLAAVEKLAEQDPLRAVALARGEFQPQLRRQLLEAAFRGWGKVNASAAADWVLAQPEHTLDANAAIAAALIGAGQNPEAAVQLTRQLDQSNPGQARDYGDALIYGLGQNGNFQRAADFAASGSGELRDEWLAAAYGNWANYQPQDAAASARQISSPDVRGAALDAVISGWGRTDPKGLADFAMNSLPDGGQKTRALSDALVCWADSDAADAATWINEVGPGPALDQGAAAIATQQEVMKQPDLALCWAQAITDVNLRSRTIAAVVQTWLLTDPSAARSFLETSPDLLPDDRAELLATLDSPAN